MDWSTLPGQSDLQILLQLSMGSRGMQLTVCPLFQQIHRSSLPTTSRSTGFFILKASRITPLVLVVTSRHPSWLLISEDSLRLCLRILKTPCSRGTLMAIFSLLWGKLLISFSDLQLPFWFSMEMNTTIRKNHLKLSTLSTVTGWMEDSGLRPVD